MSNQVENRVVNMKFDNAKFEAGIKKSIGSLSKLKDALSFGDVGKGFSNITAAASKVDLSNISDAVDTTRLSFSALDVVAATTIANVTNSLIQFSKNTFKEFMIDPITQGFEEYEIQMNSIQTILANTKTKGTTLDDVNAALEELNTYADNTIYNFASMTDAIGKFTTAGIDLSTSVGSIKGLANVGALFGAQPHQVASGMYQISQALSTGYVRLEDWMSLENSSMAGEGFKNALIETARVMGTGVDAAIEKYGSFNQSLTEGQWLTTDVLTQTLNAFTGDVDKQTLLMQGYTEAQADSLLSMAAEAKSAATEIKTFTGLMGALKEAVASGWAKTWQILIGDFEEAKVLFGDLQERLGGLIGAFNDARNNVLEGWAELGGRDVLLETIYGIFENLANVMGAIGRAWKEVFPPKTAEDLMGITEGFSEFMDGLKFGDKAIQGIEDAFKGLFSVLKLVIDILKIPLQFLPGLITLFGAVGDIVTRVAGHFGWFIEKIASFVSEAGQVDEISTKLSDGFTWMAQTIKELVENFDISNILDGFAALGAPFAFVVDGLRAMGDAFLYIIGLTDRPMGDNPFVNFIDTIREGLTWIADRAGDIFDMLMENVDKSVENFKEFWANIDWDSMGKFATGGVIAGIAGLFGALLWKIAKGLGGFLNGVGSVFGGLGSVFDPLGGAMEGVVGVLDGVQGSLEAYQKNLKADTLIKIGQAMLMLVGAIGVLSFIDSDKLKSSTLALAGLMASLTAASVVMSVWGAGSVSGLFAMSAGILALSFAVKNLARIKIEEIMTGILGIVGLMGTMLGMSTAMSVLGVGMAKGSMGMILFAGAITVLGAAVGTMSQHDPVALATAVGGIIALSFTMVGVQAILSKLDEKKSSVKIIAFAFSIQQLAKVVNSLAGLSWDELKRGLLGLVGVMTAFGAFAFAMNAINPVQAAVSILPLAAGLLALSGVIVVLSWIPWDTFADGLAKVGLGLTVLVTAMNFMPPNMLGIGAGLALISTTLLAMTGSIMALSLLDWDKAIVGVGALAGGIMSLAGATRIMASNVKGAATLMMLSSVLGPLTLSLAALSMLDASGVGTALLAIGGGLGVMVGALWLLAPLAPLMVPLGLGLAAIAGAGLLFGTGVGVLGGGLTLLAAGITAFAGAMLAVGGSATLIVDGVLLSFGLFVKGIAKMAPDLAKAVSEFASAVVTGWLSFIKNSGGEFTEMVSVMVVKIMDALKTSIPALVDGFLTIMYEVTSALSQNASPIIENIANFLISSIRALKEYIPTLVIEGIDLFILFGNSLVEGLLGHSWDDVMDAVAAVTILAGFMKVLALLGPLTGAAMVGALGFGAVLATLTGVLSLFGTLALIPGFQEIIADGGSLIATLGKAIGGFFGSIIGGIAEGSMSTLPEIGEHMSNFMDSAKGFFDAAGKIDEQSLDALPKIAGGLLAITGATFIKGVMDFLMNKDSITEMGEELVKFAPYMAEFSRIMGDVDPTVVTASANAVEAVSKFAKLSPKSGGFFQAITGETDMGDFGGQLYQFGIYFADYANAIKDVDTSVITASSAAIETVMAFSNNAPNEGGLLGWIMGENDIGILGGQLYKFGTGMSGYYESIKTIDPSLITASSSAVETIMQFAGNAPNEGGLLSWIMGDNKLDKFGSNLSAFGFGLASYGNSLTSVNFGLIDQGTRSADILMSTLAEIPNSGGIISWFSGDNTIEDIAKELPQLGSALCAFSESAKDISVMNIMTGTTAIDYILGSLTKLPDIPNNMLHFEDAMTSFGDMLVNFGIKTADLDFTSMRNVTDELQNVANVVSDAENFDASTVKDFAKDVVEAVEAVLTVASYDVSDSAIKFDDMGKAIAANISRGITESEGRVETAVGGVFTTVNQSVAESSVNIGAQVVDSISIALTHSTSKMHTAGVSVITAIVAGMSSMIHTADAPVNTVLTNVINTVRRYTINITNSGKVLMQNLAIGMNQGSYQVSTAATNAISGISNSVNAKYYDMVSAGKFLMQGLTQGIQQGSWSVNSAMNTMATSAVQTAMNKFDINSPSKVFAKMGYWIDAGLANGISDYSRVVDKSVDDVGGSAIDKMRNAINSMVTDDINDTLTIKPVLDLSDIQNKKSAISNLLGGMSVGTTVKTSKGLNVGGVDSGNSAMLSALMDLKKSVEGINTGVGTQVGNITYDDGTAVQNAVGNLVQAINIHKRR